jgi:hypothetical protein
VRKLLRVLPIACLCLGLLPAASHAELIGRSTDISLGKEAAQEFERSTPVDGDPLLAARVQRIGERLIAVGETPPFPFEFHEVDTNEINAFALPGGYVYFYRGLAQLMPGDDAMAFVLAHEITHVVRRHGIHQMEKSVAITTLVDSVLGRSTASGLIELVADMHYSRQDEAEADRLGLMRMAKAGFDPSQGVEAMAVIARVANAEKHMPALLRSHPLPESRMAALRREAAQIRAETPPAPKVAPGPPLPAAPSLPMPPAQVTASDLFPLAVGTRWTYRVTGAATAPGSPAPRAFTTSVLEQEPGQAGIYRVRTELGDGLAATRLLAVTAGGVYALRDHGSRPAAGTQEPLEKGGPPVVDQVSDSPPAPVAQDRPAPGELWQREIDLTQAAAADGAKPVEETVKVPAGEYRAVRTVESLPGGGTATVWLAPGVGMVRRAWSQSGLVEELESYYKPVPEQEQGKAAPKASG